MRMAKSHQGMCVAKNEGSRVLSPYGVDENSWSPGSSQSSNCTSPGGHSPTLNSLHMDQYYSQSPSHNGLQGASPHSSNNFNLNNTQSLEPPHKIFPEVAFEDLSASFKNLYKSVFDASQSTSGFGSMGTTTSSEISPAPTGASSLSSSLPQNQQQQFIMQNMESLIESMNKGNWQEFDLNQWNSLMESMKDFNFQNLGFDAGQWQELAFSFSHYLQSQGLASSNQGAMPGSSQNTALLSSPRTPPQQYSGTPHSSLQGSRTSYSSSTSFSGNSSTHSVPGIKVTPVARPSGGNADDEDEEDFDWESIL